MTTGINNIDKFFRDLFQNFRVKPKPDSWDKIADALDNTNPKDALIPDIDEIGTLFKGYKVTPSEGVWQNIYRILEKDKFTIGRLTRSAVSAIVAFFSNTTATVITSVVLVGGIAMLITNPFKDNSLNTASTPKTQQVETARPTAHPSVSNQVKTNDLKQTAQLQSQQKLTATENADYSSQINEPKHIAKTDKTVTTPAHISEAFVANNVLQPQKQVDLTISAPVLTTNKNEDIKISTRRNEILLTKYPSIKTNINQTKFRTQKGKTASIDLQKKMDDLIDRDYRKWAKKFNRNRDVFYVEAYYLPIYGSTTFIAHQENYDTINRSYNEYLIGSPGNCLGINFGYNPNKILIETGISYEDRHTQRDDDLTWIDYKIKQDSIGFVFNTIDSTYHTLYSIDTVKTEMVKEYSSRMTYHTLEIPLLFGYKLIDKRNSLIIRTGLLTSFIIKSGEEVSNIDETAKPFIIYPERNKVDFSYILNLSYDFNINDNFRISATPTFRYNITGMYKGYQINKGAATIGLGLGVKYLF